ncbi:MAG: DUF1338 family protein, partial [Crocinitomicaceae bacterium]|nr:DUF1338 family protein [Crocinitomicaceae bacterium]
IIKNALDTVEPSYFDKELALRGRLWGTASHVYYETLRKESEYAAWTYLYGIRVNHFTVFINSLKQFNGIEEDNTFLKEAGYKMNASGGEIKGTPELLLEQSSVLADLQEIEFEEGKYTIPTCFYEFAKRYKDTDGKLFLGFHADSANKIFESTDLALQS